MGESSWQRAGATPHGERGASTILLVEDNEMNSDMLARRLSRRGYRVLVATSGQAGVETARAEGPDLILMDVGLPDIDGFEVTRLLKAEPRTSSIPVILLTAHVMATNRLQALAAGGDDYDVKPVQIDRLLEKIDALLHRRSS